jgi:hypothetical protein
MRKDYGDLTKLGEWKNFGTVRWLEVSRNGRIFYRCTNDIKLGKKCFLSIIQKEELEKYYISINERRDYEKI